MSGDGVVVKWPGYQDSISTWIELLGQTKELVDCTITAGRRSIPVHRFVLSSCSPYFRSIFSSVPPHQHPVIVVPVIEENDLDTLVQFMYSGQVSVSQDRLPSLMKAARSLDIVSLSDLPVQVKNH